MARLQHPQQARRHHSYGGGHGRPSARHRVPKCLGKRKASLVVVDLLAVLADDVPLSAELVDALSSHVAGSLVANEVVERVTCVRDLSAAITASRGADQTGATLGSLRRAVAE